MSRELLQISDSFFIVGFITSFYLLYDAWMNTRKEEIRRGMIYRQTLLGSLRTSYENELEFEYTIKEKTGLVWSRPTQTLKKVLIEN